MKNILSLLAIVGVILLGGKLEAAPTHEKVFVPGYKTSKIRYVKQPLRIGNQLDVQVELGVMLNKPPVTSQRFFSRAKLGWLFAHEPWILSVGAVMEGSGVPSLAWGVQLEVTHLWQGMWGQSTFSVDEHGKFFSSLACGWSLLGFEWQRRLSGVGTITNGYFLKLRIPIGIVLFAL